MAQGTGEVTAGVLLDGLLVRDLQLPLGHKYAFLLRPLPTRAQVRAAASVCLPNSL